MAEPLDPARFGTICHATSAQHPFAPERSTVLCTPSNEAELGELFALARRDGLVGLPVGSATKLGLAAAPARLDFLISTLGLRAVLAFEPGDGTVTAQGGARLADLASLAHSGGRDLVPRYAPSRATLGGAIATAEPGHDRLRRGPLREHVLGMRVMLPDGTTSKSGGRLVKNVAGYDLHRLHLGAWGALGVVLEATLRLFPRTQARRTLSVQTDDTQLPRALFDARLAPEQVTVELGARQTLHATFAGREDVVAVHLDRARELLGDDAVEGARPLPTTRPAAIFQAMPSRASDLRALARTILERHPEAELTLEPLVAQLHCRLPGRPQAAAAKALDAFNTPPHVQRWPRRRQPERKQPGDDLRRELERALDPTGTLAKLA